MGPLLERARAFEAELVALRRDLHRHPELAFRESRTAAAAAERVEAAGFGVRTGVGRTGVVAELGDGGGPTVALRADMDALPIQEESDADYRSTVPGVMHACGHDAHVSMLVGAARLLAQTKEAGELPAGTVRLLFQPSEEGCDEENKSGATRMVEDGAMEDVDAVFGLHIGAHLPAGTLHLRAGAYMAGTDGIRATILGRSAHAARPEEGVDAVVLAAHFVLACQNAVARRIAPTDAGVLTLGSIAGGTAENIIAERVAIEGTLRYFEEDVRARLHGALDAAAALVEALGGRAQVTVRPGYPPVVNDEAMTELARGALVGALGAERIREWRPWMGAEDFAILQREAPGCFFWLGAALEPPREHHHPRFDVDERVLPLGASALAACAIRALGELAG
ncbi:MAG TPA: amidohydrolase [Longimicrobiales bacterium]|nr:amidohydrolase [Longimicrobiales bacterium]